MIVSTKFHYSWHLNNVRKGPSCKWSLITEAEANGSKDTSTDVNIKMNTHAYLDYDDLL